jgi:hypothetical protein
MSEENHLKMLLRKTMVTFRPDEVAFVYFTKDRVDKNIFAARFGDKELEEDGVTYSLTKADLNTCFKCRTPELSKFSWVMSITPCAARVITSISVPSIQAHTQNDVVITRYAPAFAAATNGMTVVHFIREEDANEFKRRLEN